MRKINREELLSKFKDPIKVLDHGYVQLVDVMGGDSDIVEAARVSYSGEQTAKTSDDRTLIRYLMRHYHCYSPDMQVLTGAGWKRWDECSWSETFIVPDPETKTLKKEQLDLEVFDFEGELCCFQNNRMSYQVTPEHRMYFKKKYAKTFEVTEAQSVLSWGHYEPIQGYSLLDSPEELKAPEKENELRFIGFYLGDGHRASTNRISFHLKKERKKDYLRKLIQDLTLDVEEKQSSTYADATIFYIQVPIWFEDYLPGSFGFAKAKNKSFPKEILLYLNKEEITALLDGLVNSDGSIKKDRPQIEYSSDSSKLLELFEYCSVTTGYDAHRTHWNVSAKYTGEKTTLESRKQYLSKKPYKGKVFCTSTSTGFLVVRGAEDKFAFICGNSTPIETGCVVKFQIKLPIFVERQWARHRMASWNEMSARYSILPKEFYIPEASSTKAQSKTNKQGREENLSEDVVEHYRDSLELISNDNYERYEEFAENGIARELARYILPVNIYTAKVWKQDLHNLFHFLRLRMDSHAQWEIRQYANAIAEVVKEWVPYTWEAFEDYRLNSISFSAPEIKVLQRLLHTPDEFYLDELLRLSKLSKREVAEFKDKLVKIHEEKTS